MQKGLDFEPIGGGPASIDGLRGDTDHILLALDEVSECVQASVTVRGDGVALTLRDAFVADLVAGDDAVLLILWRRFPANNDTL